ncbi:MAG: AAC(3) family N-acetyltransferase [Planctomycetota bacterium]|jgi:aminoglycoside 3-N-acetyltransferase
MSEADAISAVREPATVETLDKDLRQLGVSGGMTLIVHSSLSSLGWVCGGPQAVILALQQVVTKEGTLLMPSHSTQNSDPSGWQNPPIPKDWVSVVRENQPAFDPTLTPTRGMGAIADMFWRGRDVVRGDHPSSSFAAWGKDAAEMVFKHAPENTFAPDSPIGRVYECDGHILLLGIGHDRNTSLHLAEHRADWSGKNWRQQGAAMFRDGRRVWAEWREFENDSSRFTELAEKYAAQSPQAIKHGQVANASCQLMKSRPLIDFGVEYVTNNWSQTSES